MNRLIISTLLLLFISCDPLDERLIIINKTNRPLFFTISRFDSIEGGNPFEKYIKVTNKDTLWLDSDNFIKPYGENNFSTISSWEDQININFNGSLKLFVFDADTLKKYDWHTIKFGKKEFQKLILSVDELKKMNWKVEIKK